VDVLFGDHSADPRVNWNLLDRKINLGDNELEARPSFRKGPLVTPDKPTLKIQPDGTFRILQVADMHFSTGWGECRNAYPTNYGGPQCHAE
jgi:hypothetical protein